jgi:hypothetical protein
MQMLGAFSWKPAIAAAAGVAVAAGVVLAIATSDGDGKKTPVSAVVNGDICFTGF